MKSERAFSEYVQIQVLRFEAALRGQDDNYLLDIFSDLIDLREEEDNEHQWKNPDLD